MSAFTTLSSGGNAQSLVMANELVLAYSERRQAISQSAVSALSAGDNAQDKTLWLAMQNWLEANCTSFIDHVNGPFNGAGNALRYFTLATWQAVAGLNVSAVDGESFRRRINPEDADSYGHAVTGDCRGSWCFEDLQKGFGALKWTTRDFDMGPVVGELNLANASGNYFSAYEDAYNDCLTKFEASKQYFNGNYAWCEGGVVWTSDGGGGYKVNMKRDREYFKTYSTYPIDMVSCELWAMAIKDFLDIFDANSEGWIENVYVKAIEGGACAKNVNIDIGWVGSLDVPNIPEPVYNADTESGYLIPNTNFILISKWNFTNT